MVTKTVTINGVTYAIIPTRRFRVSGGYMGRKGIEVFKKGDTSQTSQRYESMAEFRRDLKARKKYLSPKKKIKRVRGRKK